MTKLDEIVLIYPSPDLSLGSRELYSTIKKLQHRKLEFFITRVINPKIT